RGRFAESAVTVGGEPLPIRSHGSDTLNWVSCIMPTADRRAFVPESIRLFLAQDYPQRELVILDDGADPVADLLPRDGRIRYIRGESQLSIGAKRNLACAAAQG